MLSPVFVCVSPKLGSAPVFTQKRSLAVKEKDLRHKAALIAEFDRAFGHAKETDANPHQASPDRGVVRN